MNINDLHVCDRQHIKNYKKYYDSNDVTKKISKIEFKGDNNMCYTATDCGYNDNFWYFYIYKKNKDKICIGYHKVKTHFNLDDFLNIFKKLVANHQQSIKK